MLESSQRNIHESTVRALRRVHNFETSQMKGESKIAWSTKGTVISAHLWPGQRGVRHIYIVGIYLFR